MPPQDNPFEGNFTPAAIVASSNNSSNSSIINPQFTRQRRIQSLLLQHDQLRLELRHAQQMASLISSYANMHSTAIRHPIQINGNSAINYNDNNSGSNFTIESSGSSLSMMPSELLMPMSSFLGSGSGAGGAGGGGGGSNSSNSSGSVGRIGGGTGSGANERGGGGGGGSDLSPTESMGNVSGEMDSLDSSESGIALDHGLLHAAQIMHPSHNHLSESLLRSVAHQYAQARSPTNRNGAYPSGPLSSISSSAAQHNHHLHLHQNQLQQQLQLQLQQQQQQQQQQLQQQLQHQQQQHQQHHLHQQQLHHHHPHASRGAAALAAAAAALNANNAAAPTTSATSMRFRSKPVCCLLCRFCTTPVCNRGMKAILLADSGVELFSTDLPPSTVGFINIDYVTQKCLCRIRDIACLSCGNNVGYHVTQPCKTCLNSCNNGHFWMFHKDYVTYYDRKVGEKGIFWAELPNSDQDTELIDRRPEAMSR